MKLKLWEAFKIYLAYNLKDRRQTERQIMAESIKIAIRVRPFNDKENAAGQQNCIEMVSTYESTCGDLFVLPCRPD